jgi:hypothetical protein
MQTLMQSKIDYITDGVVERYASSTGERIQPNTTYTPTIYTTAESTTKLDALREQLSLRSDIKTVTRERWKPAFRYDPETVLQIPSKLITESMMGQIVLTLGCDSPAESNTTISLQITNSSIAVDQCRVNMGVNTVRSGSYQ